MKICVLASDFKLEPEGGRDLPLNRIVRGIAKKDKETEFHVITKVKYKKKMNKINERIFVYSFPFFDKRMFDLIDTLNRKIKFDIIHGFDVYPEGQLAAVISERLQKLCIIGVRGSKSLIAKLYDKSFLDYISNVSDTIVFVSNDLLEKFNRKASGNAKLRVIYNSTDYKKCYDSSAEKEKDFIIGNISFLGDKRILKGVIFLLKAFKIFSEKVKDSKLIIIGVSRKEGETEIHRYVKDNNLNGRVIFHEIMPHWKIYEHMEKMNIYVSPSIFEGIPAAVLEAMMLKKPVLATDVGGIREIIKDGHDGILVKSFSEKEIYKKIMFLYENEKTRRQIGDNAHKTVNERFRPEREVEEWYNAYRECLSGKK